MLIGRMNLNHLESIGQNSGIPEAARKQKKELIITVVRLKSAYSRCSMRANPSSIFESRLAWKVRLKQQSPTMMTVQATIMTNFDSEETQTASPPNRIYNAKVENPKTKNAIRA